MTNCSMDERCEYSKDGGVVNFSGDLSQPILDLSTLDETTSYIAKLLDHELFRRPETRIFN